MSELPPHNIEAEQQVLGAILFEPDALLYASDIIDGTDFYRSSHTAIFNACLDVYHDSGNLDVITLTERLKAKGELEKVGGISYLANLAAAVPTAANIRHHSQIIKEKSILRRIRTWAQAIACKVDEYDSKSLITAIEADIVDIASKITDRRSPHVSSIIAAVHHRWKAVKTEDKSAYIPASISLSNAIPYFMPGHLWAIGGYTSVGKSTFLTQLILDASEYGAQTLGFSLEDSQEDKAIKMLANLCECSQKRLMLGHTDDIKDRIRKAEEKLKKYNPIIYDDIYNTNEIRLKIKKHKLKDNINIVWLDYIQNIQGDGDMYERLSRAVTALQKIAKEMQVTIIMLSQVTNESMRANTEVIGLKGAGELAAAPDIILWLKRTKGEGRERFLDVEIRKNRPFGETGIIQLMFSESWSRIIKRHV